MEAYMERMIVERSELKGRVYRLNEFLDGDIFKGLAQSEKADLQLQLGFMTGYLAVLDRRINR